MDTPRQETPSAPYLPWRTFLNFLIRLENEPRLPKAIDRSFLRGMSGADQSQLMVALRAFSLIGEKGEIKDELVQLATDADNRPKRIGELVRSFYPEQVRLGSENGTPKQLDDSFESSFSLTGSTRQKAIRFFLSAAQYGDVPLSPFFTVPAAPRGRSAKRRTHSGSGASSSGGAGGGGGGGGGGGAAKSIGEDAKTVRLPSGATLTLSISQSTMSLPRDERKFVLEVVDLIEDRYDDSAQGLEDDLEED